MFQICRFGPASFYENFIFRMHAEFFFSKDKEVNKYIFSRGDKFEWYEAFILDVQVFQSVILA